MLERTDHSWITCATPLLVDIGICDYSIYDNYSQSYDDIVATPYADTGGDEGETIALTGVENENFPEIKTWILTTLEAHVVS